MRYSGVFTALLTPMKNGALDQDSLNTLLDEQMAKGIDGLVVAGTTGEAATLTDDEQVQLVEWVMERTDGAIPIIAGVGTYDTRTTVARAQRMEEIGVDGLLVVTPYYNKPTQAGLAQHFSTVAGAVSCSICLYNVPSRTAVSLDPATIEQLAVLPNVDAIKEATLDMERAALVIAAAGDNANVLAGDDTAFLPMLSLGASGIVSAASNVLPEPFAKMNKLFNWGDLEEARELHYRYLEIIRALFTVVNPLGIKIAAKAMALIESDEVRLPLLQLTDEEAAPMLAKLRAGGIIG